MGKLIIHQEKINNEVAEKLVAICPFNAIEYKNGKLDINSGCKMCKMCVRKGPVGAITYEEDQVVPQIDKSKWKGIAIFAEIDIDRVHPVVFELIGKAKELVKVTGQEVFVILISDKAGIDKHSEEILSYGVDKLYIYEDDKFKNFNVQTYAKAVEDFVEKIHPSVILYGGTALGRQFAPKIAAHFKTGLTADCTKLGMKENSDLIQVRPAFGGNVMAQIICTNTRPQMATVRYKIFQKPAQCRCLGQSIYMETKDLDFTTGIIIKNIIPKPKAVDISEADVIVACGRPFKTEEQFKMAEELATLLGGIVAVSRPLVEDGIKDAKYQIGLSGKTVAPKLIITLGISGSVQFAAGMTGSQTIISINTDPNAPIFDIAQYSLVGDVFKIVPKLIEKIKEDKEA